MALDGYGLRDQLPARPAKDASYPISVRQVAVLIHASFRRHLAMTPLRFTNPSPPSGWIGDFHPQTIEHAGHTTKPLRGGWPSASHLGQRGGFSSDLPRDTAKPLQPARTTETSRRCLQMSYRARYWRWLCCLLEANRCQSLPLRIRNLPSSLWLHDCRDFIEVSRVERHRQKAVAFPVAAASPCNIAARKTSRETAEAHRP